jgi:hypothetical protein
MRVGGKSVGESQMKKLLLRLVPQKRHSVLSFFSFITVFNYAIAYCVSEYYRHQSFASILSFDSSDQPGPLETILYPPRALFGTHFFGDFFQILQMSKLHTPYVSENAKLISQYPPIGHWIVYPFTFLSTRTAVFIYICIAVGMLLLALRKLTERIDPEHRPHVMMLFVLSGPVISILDRGNTTVFIFCITVLTLFVKMSWFSKVILQILSIGMKFYPVLFFLEIEKQQESKRIKSSLILELTGVLALSLLGMFILGSGFRSNLQGLSHAFSDQGRIENDVRIPGVSISAFLEGIQSLANISISTQSVSLIGLGISLFTFVFLFLQYVGPLSKKNHLEERMVSIIVFLSIAPKIVGSYQLIFLLIPLVLYLKQDIEKKTISINTVFLICLILPMRYEVSEGVYLNSILFGPMLVLLIINIFFEQARRT